MSRVTAERSSGVFEKRIRHGVENTSRRENAVKSRGGLDRA